jgi:hypothetical protein
LRMATMITSNLGYLGQPQTNYHNSLKVDQNRFLSPTNFAGAFFSSNRL